MVTYKKYSLENGLRLIVHQDPRTDVAAVNLMVDVGAKDEAAEMTGLAHLFEHLMFEGSQNVPVYDRELEKAGGENNAFTNNDITNYFVTLPAANLETALWLESDRMMSLNLDPKKLEIQKRVVIEEFKERYLNQPYGDLWALVRALSYKVHPYRWPTIGKDIQHIEKVSRSDVQDFYRRFYTPDNAILTVASPLSPGEVYRLTQKWFGELSPAEESYKRALPKEPGQQQPRFQEVERDAPSSMIVRAFPMADRLSEDYYVHDLISDILANGESSRLKYTLMKKQELFSQIDAYISGDIEPGLLVIAGKINDEVEIQEANNAIDHEINKLMEEHVSEYEIRKVKNKALIRLENEKTGVLEKAMNLSFYELLGQAGLFEKQADFYHRVSREDVLRECKKIFSTKNHNTLFYRAKEKNDKKS
ncbi:MAG: pitrilysin family protein [Bacteroidales bacterium]